MAQKASCLALLLLAGCYTVHTDGTKLDGQDVVITFLHTSDWHARVLPYFEELNSIDKGLGLSQDAAPFGGVARMKTIIDEQRRLSQRVLHLDSGDCFQGAPIFNVF